MEYIVSILVILIYATAIILYTKKRIEQTIPIAIVEIVLIVFVAGLFDSLRIGMMIVEIIAVIKTAMILCAICRKKDIVELKEIADRIFTPGLAIYVLLCVISVVMNKGRIFENYDEFNHWARIIKNMFQYGTYGTNPESVVVFNEYPPFTAIFQYLFLFFKNSYKEDISITAQNILYFSMVIPMMKQVEWKKKQWQKMFYIVPLIICIPMIFYKNFYYDILVDGMIGIAFGMMIFHGLKQEENIWFKIITIASYTIIVILTKTTGIPLALLAIIAILIKVRKEKREIIGMLGIVVVSIMLLSSWYIKVSNSEKRWDFIGYIQSENKERIEIGDVSQTFIKKVILGKVLTDKNLTILEIASILIGTSIYLSKKQKTNMYGLVFMLGTVPLYLIGLFITYFSIFETSQILTSFERYVSLILLANVIFQVDIWLEGNNKLNYGKTIFIIYIILMILLPQENIVNKYINKKNYVITSNMKRASYTKMKKYQSMLTGKERILYIYGKGTDGEYLLSMNQYVMMPVKITGSMPRIPQNKDTLKQILESGEYTHIYIDKIEEQDKEGIKELFEDEYVGNNILYEITDLNSKTVFKRVKNKKEEVYGNLQ